MVDASKQLLDLHILGANFNAKGTLANSVVHVGGVKSRSDTVAKTKAVKTGNSQNNARKLGVGIIKLGQARLHVAADGFKLEIGEVAFQLGRTTNRRGADNTAIGEISKSCVR